jgi:hypothetical protein
MPDEKNPDQLVADSMSKLFGSMGPATTNPMGVATAAKPITGKFRIEGRVVWEDSGLPVVGISLGLGGIETVTNERGEFTLKIEKK